MKPMMSAWVCLTAFAFAISAGEANGAETIVSKSVFHGGPHAPADTASGGASVIQLDNGQYELRFGDDFTTTDGPDLFIYLSAAEDPGSDKAVANSAFVDAGILQSTSGGQTYPLPAGFDPGRFKSVAVWCKQFSVLFGAAPLVSP